MPIVQISNGDDGLDVRGRLNSAITQLNAIENDIADWDSIKEITVTVGETGGVAAGQLVYIKPADGKAWLADASAEATVSGVIGVATQNRSLNSSLLIRIGGVYLYGDPLNPLTIGPYYASDTPGDMSTSAGTVERVIGYAVDEYNLLIVQQNPVSEATGSGGDAVTTITLNAGENVLPGEIVYLASDGTFYLADASAEATSGPVLIGLSANSVEVDAGSPLTVQISGEYTYGSAVLTAGSIYYVSETAGQRASTVPISIDSVVRPIGYAISTTKLLIYSDVTYVTNSIDVATINTQTGTTYTLAITDASRVVEMNNGSANTVTIPAEQTVDFPVGTTIDVVQIGAGLTTVKGATGVVVNGSEETGLGETENDSQGQWKALSLYKRAADEWVVLGGA